MVSKVVDRVSLDHDESDAQLPLFEQLLWLPSLTLRRQLSPDGNEVRVRYAMATSCLDAGQLSGA